MTICDLCIVCNIYLIFVSDFVVTNIFIFND